MKPFYNPTLLSILMLFILYSCNHPNNDAVRKIRIAVNRINNDRSLKKVILENEDFFPQATDGGCSLTGYLKDGQICKIKVWIGLSYSVKQYEYYFENTHLILIYETEEDYPATNSALDYTRLDKVFEARYYIDAGAVVKAQITGRRRMNSGTTDDNAGALIADVKEYTALINTHIKKK